ncbi:MAG: Purine or other phosphorylase family 1 [Chloroflexi bacterium]|nr:MAG: Purine or other phosphorylase family 1 [Chloroflexota bacterium]
MTQKAPILEFDDDRSAILMPDPYRFSGGKPVPARGVLCFFKDVLDDLLEKNELMLIGYLGSEMGKHPVYSYNKFDKPITVFHPGVGAPLAAGFLDELIAVGVARFIVCGGCGVLDPEIVAGHPVILTSAVRDEGTSYHYLPPSREVKPHPVAVEALEKIFIEAGLDYRMGKTWTTDAIYRETPGRRNLRLEEGCDVVEMEAAAFFAVAKFREIILGQVVYGGDLVVPEGWDGRDWHKRGEDRRLMFDMAVKAALLL